MYSYCEGLPRKFWKNFSHICVELSFLGKNKMWLWAEGWWGMERNWLLFVLSVVSAQHDEGRHMGFLTGWGLCVLTFYQCKYPESIGGHMLFVQYLSPRKMI